MARRVDSYHDPDAPPANSIVVAVTAFIQDPAGQLLLIRRTDNDLYAIPGGAQEVGETISQTVVREVRNESKEALWVQPARLDDLNIHPSTPATDSARIRTPHPAVLRLTRFQRRIPRPVLPLPVPDRPTSLAEARSAPLLARPPGCGSVCGPVSDGLLHALTRLAGEGYTEGSQRAGGQSSPGAA
ncbi:MAG: NUDIX domain-containing protein [Pseudonocardiaceae bacterium]